MLKSSKPQTRGTRTWRAKPLITKNGKGDRLRREAGLATGEGKPLKAKAQGRHRHETRPKRSQAEQSVMRLRKPEGAAQPGEANLVLVAACFRKRRRAQNPMGELLESANNSLRMGSGFPVVAFGAGR
jgi:hypothetical protein